MNLLEKLIEEGRERRKTVPIGEKELNEAILELKKYKNSKINLEKRIIEDEEFFKLQHWDYMEKEKSKKKKPSTAWLLNSVINKHADIMDSYPEAICLPREEQDKEDAKALSGIIPVIMEHNNYEQTFSDNSWYYLKHGTSCHGVFWDSTKENGLGDIVIKNVDILNLFWEPGISNIQDSKNLFYVSLVDNSVLKAMYPHIEEGKLLGNAINVSEYIYDDTVDNSDKSLVVDWYYKKTDETGRKVLHYVKFVGDTLLFSSENEPDKYPYGYYEHGEYPFRLSVMYPVSGTPYGFGTVSICKDPQLYIDTLDGIMLNYLDKVSKPRFWAKKSAGVNKKEFLDWDIPIVEVEGDIDDEKLKQITLQSIGGFVQNVRQMKVDELKETSSNRDFSQGSTSSGVTSGAAIATLQEAGNKTSRDMLKGLYRAYSDVVRLVIELVRQFYDEAREFRILGSNGGYEFTSFSNENIKEHGTDDGSGNITYRRPIFDISIKAQKSNPYAKLSQNETAVNLYKLGIFNPDNSQQALALVNMMDFEGKDDVKRYILEGQTLLNIVKQQQEQLMQLSQIVSELTGRNLINAEVNPSDRSTGINASPTTDKAAEAFKSSQREHEQSYAERLARRGQ